MANSDKIRLAIAIILKICVLAGSIYLIVLSAQNHFAGGFNKLIFAIAVLFIIYTGLSSWQLLRNNFRRD